MKVTKFDLIKPYVGGKNVLDVGCVDHSLMLREKRKVWVHDFLRENSKYVLGIDILKKEIEELNKTGYNMKVLNAEELCNHKFKQKFDVVFAGELIEHLSNPGLFIEGAGKNLKKGGLLILTTPNAFSTRTVFQVLRTGGGDPDVNPEHTNYFSPTTLKELLRRHSFKVEKIEFVDPQIGNNWKKFLRGIIEMIRGKDTLETMVVISSKS